MPVFPNFRRDMHVAKGRIEPKLGLPLLFGWDFGLTPACIVAQMQGTSLKVLHEWVSKNEGIKTFAPKVMNEIRFMYPEWSNPAKDHFHWIDPAGFARAQTDARTCAQEMTEHAPIVNLEPGPVTFSRRKSDVEHFLLKIDKDGAGLELDPETTPTLTEGFAGGYRYADAQTDIESAKPEAIKDQFSHPHDAFQYLCHGARAKMSSYGMDVNIPMPQYNFTKESTSKGNHNYGRTIKKSH
jgi:hypothetical protein